MEMKAESVRKSSRFFFLSRKQGKRRSEFFFCLLSRVDVYKLKKSPFENFYYAFDRWERGKSKNSYRTSAPGRQMFMPRSSTKINIQITTREQESANNL